MVKLKKFTSNENTRKFILISGFSTISLSFIEIYIFGIVKIDIFILIILASLIFPGLSSLLDGLLNKFSLKEVELFKIFSGLIMTAYVLMLFYFYYSNILIDISFVISLITLELLMLGSSKVLIGKINVEYVDWYRKFLVLIGMMIVFLSLVNFFIPFLRIIYFKLIIFITLMFDGFSYILYGLIKNIEKTKI